jgi:hypothetical protein
VLIIIVNYKARKALERDQRAMSRGWFDFYFTDDDINNALGD